MLGSVLKELFAPEGMWKEQGDVEGTRGWKTLDQGRRCFPVGAGSVSCSSQRSLPIQEVLGQPSAPKPDEFSHRWGANSAQAFPSVAPRPMGMLLGAGGPRDPPNCPPLPRGGQSTEEKGKCLP